MENLNEIQSRLPISNNISPIKQSKTKGRGKNHKQVGNSKSILNK